MERWKRKTYPSCKAIRGRIRPSEDWQYAVMGILVGDANRVQLAGTCKR